MINYSYQLVLWVLNHGGVFPAALIVSSLNMLVQILFSLVFGADHVPKLRGDRG